MKNQQGVSIQYCAKVMQAKCANFVLCSRELSTKSKRESSSENSRRFERKYVGTKGDISSNFRYLAENSRYFASWYAKFRLEQNCCPPAFLQSSPRKWINVTHYALFPTPEHKPSLGSNNKAAWRLGWRQETSCVFTRRKKLQASSESITSIYPASRDAFDRSKESLLAGWASIDLTRGFIAAVILLGGIKLKFSVAQE